MRTSVWSLPTPSYREETREFSDPATGYTVKIQLREPNIIQQAMMDEEKRKRCEHWSEPLPDGTRRRFVDPVTAQAFDMPQSLVEMLTVMEFLQPGPNRVPFEELLGISIKLPDLWEEIVLWAVTFVPADAEKQLGNASRAVEGARSSTPATPPDSLIQTSSLISPVSSDQ